MAWCVPGVTVAEFPRVASVTVTMSDPVVCNVTQGGPFQHFYVTISDVQAYTNAGQIQNGVDLTPNLSQNPMQVDLLGSPGSGCTLALEGTGLIPPIRKVFPPQERESN